MKIGGRNVCETPVTEQNTRAMNSYLVVSCERTEKLFISESYFSKQVNGRNSGLADRIGVHVHTQTPFSRAPTLKTLQYLAIMFTINFRCKPSLLLRYQDKCANQKHFLE